MVDADDGGNVPIEFVAEPFGETSASPVPAWALRWLNLTRFAGALGHVDADALAGRVSGLRAGIVDADIAVKSLLHSRNPLPPRRIHVADYFPTNRSTFDSRNIWTVAAYVSSRSYNRGIGTVIWNSKPESRRLLMSAGVPVSPR